MKFQNWLLPTADITGIGPLILRQDACESGITINKFVFDVILTHSVVRIESYSVPNFKVDEKQGYFQEFKDDYFRLFSEIEIRLGIREDIPTDKRVRVMVRFWRGWHDPESMGLEGERYWKMWADLANEVKARGNELVVFELPERSDKNKIIEDIELFLQQRYPGKP